MPEDDNERTKKVKGARGRPRLRDGQNRVLCFFDLKKSQLPDNFKVMIKYKLLQYARGLQSRFLKNGIFGISKSSSSYSFWSIVRKLSGYVLGTILKVYRSRIFD